MKNKVICFLIIILSLTMVACSKKEESLIAKLNTISGTNFNSYDYPDEKWTKAVEEGIVYMDLESLENSLELYVDYKKKEDVISIIRNDKEIFIDIKSSLIDIDQKTYNSEDLIVFFQDRPFIVMNYFEHIFGIEIEINEKEKIIVIKDKLKDYNTTVAKKKSDILEIVNGNYKKIGEIAGKGKVIVLSEDAKHYEVFTENYLYGLAKKEDFDKLNLISSNMARFETNYSKENKKIFLAWDQNYQANPKEEDYGSIEHVNVLSPVWLTYKDGKGGISSRVSPGYLKWAKENNFDVWVTITNDFNPKRTQEIISDFFIREEAISNLVNILVKNNIRGLNIDFENIYMEDKDYLVQFIAELTARCHKENILVSMDVTMMGGSDNWSRCYDRKRLGEIVDYLVIMAYDQHWASSPISGTVAGIDWVKDGLKNILEIVPKEKIILGIPLYTRLWKETPSREYVNTMKVKSKAITMAAAERIIVEKELTKIWDEINGQYFVSYIEDDTLYKIWHEDFNSLKLKAEIVKEEDLAGAAVWRRGYEAVGTWEVIQNSMGD